MRGPLVTYGEFRRGVDEELKEAFPLYLDELFDQTIGYGLIPMRRSWPESLKRRLAAAIISNNLGIGMDYALKRYVRDAEYDDSDGERPDERAERIVARTESSIADAYGFEKPDDADERDFFFYFAFRKALGTIDAAHTLAQQGYLSEALVLCREAIEKIAWSVAVSEGPGDRDPLGLTTTQGITEARRVFPELGRLYGISSKFAHWHPDVHLAFLTEMDGRTAVLLRSVPHKIASLVYVLAICDIGLRTFIRHMGKYYPDRATDACSNIAGDARKLAAEIIELAADKTTVTRLLASVKTAWLSGVRK